MFTEKKRINDICQIRMESIKESVLAVRDTMLRKIAHELNNIQMTHDDINKILQVFRFCSVQNNYHRTVHLFHRFISKHFPSFSVSLQPGKV